MTINTIGTWGQVNLTLAKDEKKGYQRSRWGNDLEPEVLGGENNAASDQLRVDGQVFYSSANVTFDVVSTQKKARGYQNKYSGNRLECMALCNEEGHIGVSFRPSQLNDSNLRLLNTAVSIHAERVSYLAFQPEQDIKIYNKCGILGSSVICSGNSTKLIGP